MPSAAKAHRLLGFGAGCRIGRAFVELHLNVGAEKVLHLDGALGHQVVKGSVDVGPERDAPFGNGAELAKRHDLVAAGVGQDRPIPAHEAVQAAKRAIRSAPGRSMR